MHSFLSSITDGSIEFVRSALVEGLVAGLISTIGILAVTQHARHEWRSGQFKDRMNISLNIVSDETLRIRTIVEDQVRNMVLSPYAQDLIKQAVRRTTEENEFLNFPSDRDAWLVYNEIINTISEACGPQLLSVAARATELKEASFLIALTYERSKDVRIQKLRVLVVEESVLAHISSKAASGGIGLEVEHHRPRLRTLTKMYGQFTSGNWPPHQIIALPCV